MSERHVSRLGLAVRLIRTVENRSQAETAGLIGISKPTLSRIENGLTQPSFSVALKILNWLAGKIGEGQPNER